MANGTLRNGLLARFRHRFRESRCSECLRRGADALRPPRRAIAPRLERDESPCRVFGILGGLGARPDAQAGGPPQSGLVCYPDRAPAREAPACRVPPASTRIRPSPTSAWHAAPAWACDARRAGLSYRQALDSVTS